MATESVRIGAEEKAKVDEIAETTGATRRHIIDTAIAEYYERWKREQEMLKKLREQEDGDL